MPLAENIIGRLGDLDDVTIVVRRPSLPDGMLTIERSGKLVDRLYRAALVGEPVSKLTPSHEDAENEIAVVLASGRALMIEDQVRLPAGPARIARLYLPFADKKRYVAGAIVGIVGIN